MALFSGRGWEGVENGEQYSLPFLQKHHHFFRYPPPTPYLPPNLPTMKQGREQGGRGASNATATPLIDTGSTQQSRKALRQ